MNKNLRTHMIAPLWMKLTSLLLCLVAFAPEAFANVDVRDGSFASEYQEIGHSDDDDDESYGLTRYYHSTHQQAGWFGIGWGSTYETRIIPSFNGGLILYEHGNGQAVYMREEAVPLMEKSRAIRRMVEAAQQQKPSLKTDQLEQRLNDDVEFRNRLWLQLLSQGLVQPKQMKPGQKYHTRYCGCHKLDVTDQGYRYYKNGTLFALFDQRGRMIRRLSKDGQSTDIVYAHSSITISRQGYDMIHLDTQKQGNDVVVTALTYGFEKKLRFVYGLSNHLLAAYGTEQETLNYWYGDHGLLFKVVSSSNENSLVSYRKGSSQVAAYQSGSGKLYRYQYKNTSIDKSMRTMETHESSKHARQRPRLRTFIHTFIETDDAQQSLYRREINDENLNEVTQYNPDGSPAEITHNDQVTRFEYTPETRRLIRKTTPQGIIDIDYDAQTGKITMVRNSWFNGGESWTRLKYDSNANLVYAKSSQGKIVTLSYGNSGNNKGKIVRMINKNIELQFNYNKIGKPIIIQVKGGGSIKVSYDSLGEIENVESKGGQKIAMQVTQAFQRFLAIIKPAGVTLSW